MLEGAVQPKLPAPQESIEPNTRLKHIEQFRDGKVKLSFIRNNQDRIEEYLCGSSSNMCESSSNPETIDLGRVSQLGHDFPREEKSMKFRPRFSTSDIPNSVLRNVNFQSQIPKPVYSSENDLSQNEFITKSEPTSPTFSAITDNMLNELNVLQKEFSIDKEFLRDDFYSKNNSQKRLWFFKNFLKERNNIQNEFYNYLQTHKVQILFFNWFEDYASKNNIKFPFSKTVNPITNRNKTPEWETLANGKIIRSNHPPPQGIKLDWLGTPIEAIPFKRPQEADKANIKNIIVQNNFSNTNLGTISKQLDRIEKSIQNQNPIPMESPSEKKNKSPMFKPFQISNSSVKTYQYTNLEFIRALRSQLSKAEI